MTGRCESRPENLEDGRLRMHEKWHWTQTVQRVSLLLMRRRRSGWSDGIGSKERRARSALSV